MVAAAYADAVAACTGVLPRRWRGPPWEGAVPAAASPSGGPMSSSRCASCARADVHSYGFELFLA